MIGQTISHYNILEKLGVGGMGEVYLAEDTRLLRKVAIKILPKDLLSDKEYQWRFIKEAQTASSLNHPNICTIHDINDFEGFDFIVMEYVEGNTLRQIINNRGPIKEKEVVEIASKICDALTAVHSKGILHRDIKPENIMITDTGFLKVMDFGLAKLATESAEYVAGIKDKSKNTIDFSTGKKYSQEVVLDTLSGLLGTVSYMSPDQALGKEIDQRSDIFSLGIVIYELLTNIRPFSGDTNETILYKIFSEPYRPLEIDKSNISPGMKKIIDRCLEKDPDQRYSSVSRLQIDLLSLKDGDRSIFKERNKQEVSHKHYEQERRNVTVLMAEISNYKSILSKIDPEEASNSINQFYDMFASVVEKYCGRIDKIIEGTVQVVYGAPVASENSQKEAVNTAIEIKNKLIKLNQNQQTKIELKIGINSGTVLAGMTGKGDQKKYTIFGEPVNHASNLKDLCNENQILTGALTYKLTKNEFTYDELPPIFIKGSETKSNVYLLVSNKENIYRPKLGTERQIYSEMVGRSKELKIIESHLERLIIGNGFILNIIGEAGIGKSRLKAEVRDLDVISEVTFLEGRSLSIGKNLSFHPLIDIMKNWAGIREDDSEKDWHRKLENLIFDIYPANAKEIFPFIATMLGINLTGIYAERINGIKGGALEKLILKNLREFFAHATSQKPIVIVMEDLHWIDATSLEFLEMLFKLLENSRILFINIFRPNYKDTSDKLLDFITNNYSDSHQNIVLESLDKNQGIQLINNLLKIEGMGSKTIDMINKKSGGNPFFIEEVIRSFIDEGAIILEDDKFIVTEKMNTVVIPETISEVIISRIDRLDEETKALLKKASVIGKNFFHKIIGEVASQIDDLDGRITKLKDIQLIKEHKRMDEVEYLFKHALAHEAVYNSILIKKRKELHIKTAKAIESIFSDRLPQFYGLLSYHYIKGEDFDKAEDYLIKAGDEALKISASNEAVEYFKNALSIYLDKYGNNADIHKKAMLELNIGIALQNKGKFIESLEYFNKLKTYYGFYIPKNEVMVNLKALLGFFHLWVGINFPQLKWKKIPNENEFEQQSFWMNYNNSKTLIHPKKGFLEALIEWIKGTKYDFTESEVLRVNLLGTVGIISFVGLSNKIINKTLQLLKKKIDQKKLRKDLWFKAMSQLSRWVSGNWKIQNDNDYDENLVEYGKKTGNIMMLTIYINQYSLTKIERGEYTKVRDMLRKMFEIGDTFGNEYTKSIYHVSSIKLFMKWRKFNEAFEIIESAKIIGEKLADNLTSLPAFSYTARLQIISGDIEEAEKTLKSAAGFDSKEIPPWYRTDYFTSIFNFNIYQLENSIQKDNISDISIFSKKTIASGKVALKNSKNFAGDRIEIYRLFGRYYWLINKQKKAIKWWEKSIIFGDESCGRLELSRTYFEAGKRLSEKKSKFRELNNITSNEYLSKAKAMFEVMDLEWDLEELRKFENTGN